MDALISNIGDPDHTLHSAASDLVLYRLPDTLLGVFRLQWVKKVEGPVLTADVGAGPLVDIF